MRTGAVNCACVTTRDQFNAAVKLKAIITASAHTVVNSDIFRSVSITTPFQIGFPKGKRHTINASNHFHTVEQ